MPARLVSSQLLANKRMKLPGRLSKGDVGLCMRQLRGLQLMHKR
jgi:hypothetical protein